MKVQLYRSLVEAVLLYGAESWPILADDVSRLETFQMRQLRSILGVSRRLCLRNEDIREQCGVPSIEILLRRRRLTWLGHILRQPEERLIRKVLFGQLTGSQKRGKSPTTLRKLLHNDWLALQGGTSKGWNMLSLAQMPAVWKDLIIEHII